MNNFILFTLILFTANLRAQSIWNDTISLGYPRARITDMIVDNDTIIVYGTGFNNAIEYKQGLIIAKLDSSGNVLQNKILLDSLGDKLAVDESWGKIIKTNRSFRNRNGPARPPPGYPGGRVHGGLRRGRGDTDGVAELLTKMPYSGELGSQRAVSRRSS